jgi:hypothetical protein
LGTHAGGLVTEFLLEHKSGQGVRQVSDIGVSATGPLQERHDSKRAKLCLLFKIVAKGPSAQSGSGSQLTSPGLSSDPSFADDSGVVTVVQQDSEH